MKPALADTTQYVRFIRDDRKAPQSATRWLVGLKAAINSLGEFPERYPLIPEHEEFTFEIRQMVYFSHRIIFRVRHESNRVVILRVYHGSRKNLSKKDLSSN